MTGLYRYKNRFLQIVSQSKLPPAKSRVSIQEYLDGSIHMVYRDREVVFKEIKEVPVHLPVPAPKTSLPKPNKKYVPPQDHPWRHFNLGSLPRKETLVR